MSLITIIGRGHGGTRAISHTLIVSNVFMGEPLNRSGDLLPPQAMYDACRVLARSMCSGAGRTRLGFQRTAQQCRSRQEFSDLIHEYLKTVLAAKDHAQRLENSGDHAGLSLDRAHVP
jgi:hypothetical protein